MPGGPAWWRQAANRLKKCSERTSDSCDPTETDGCCAVIPCTYCLEWEEYGSAIEYGTATFSTSGWSGSIAGAAFFGYWERNYETNECEFIVTLDGEEVYRKSCYEGQSCRDSSDEVAVSLEYLEGTLRWIKLEKRPLAYRTDEDTQCRTWFCGDCECTCECLCVTITDSLGVITTGELCDTAYPCDAPLWEGVVGDLSLSLALSRDVYGECQIGGSIDYDEVDPQSIVICDAISVTWELYDGTTVAVACKGCDCAEAASLCCGGRNLAGDLTLTLVYPGTSIDVECGDTVLTLTEGGDGYWTGSSEVIAEIPGGGGEECVPFTAYFRFFCDPAGPFYQLEWYIEYLGTRRPATGWCGLIALGEDCDCPFVGSWGENNIDECALSFWNGFYTFVVTEPADAC